MDSFDLFQQLTKGAKFNKKRRIEQQQFQKTIIKDESFKCESKKDEGDDDESDLDANDTADLDVNTIKSEIDEIDTEPIDFRYVSDVVIQPPRKKAKRIVHVDAEKKLKMEEDAKVALLRKTNNISVLGKNVPDPITSFHELQLKYNVLEHLIENIQSCKCENPTSIQMQAIPIMLEGRPLMACAPTGSGKTIAFLTPIINSLRVPKKDGFRAIVLAPTRELAQQIYRECVRLSEKTALRIHLINKVSQAKRKFGPESNMKFDILISTPNRIRYLLQQEPPILNLNSIEWFVIDEADRLMEDGQNNFKEQIDDILAACTNPSKKIALFSATYTVPVAKWALKNLKHLVRVTVGQHNAATDTVDQELLFVGDEGGKLLAIRDLVRSGLKPPVLIFLQSKDRARQLFQELLYDGINIDVIHSDRTRTQRDNCIRAFRDGHIWVLICTELMSRGIDFKGVNLVINYDFPPSVISYIHRIGRSGRAGRPGKAITFFTQNDTPNLRNIAQIIRNSGGKVPDYMLQIKKPRKSQIKELLNFAPKRDDISTGLNFKKKPSNEKDELLSKVAIRRSAKSILNKKNKK